MLRANAEVVDFRLSPAVKTEPFVRAASDRRSLANPLRRVIELRSRLPERAHGLHTHRPTRFRSELANTTATGSRSSQADEEFSLPAALSLAPLYLLGIGFLAAAPLLRTLANSPGARTTEQRWATLAGVFSIGILVNYLLILLLESLPLALAVGAVLAFAGLYARNSRTAAVARRGTLVRRRIECVALDLCTAGRGDRRPLRGADPHDSVDSLGCALDLVLPGEDHLLCGRTHE